MNSLAESHGELRRPDVDGRDTGACRCHGPDGRPARQIGPVLVALQRHPGLIAGQRERRRRPAVGGIAQIGLHLEHRTGVDLDQVARLVTVRVVRVRRVCHVAGGHHRSGQPTQVVLPGAARGEHDPFQHGRQQLGLGTVIRRRADLLVVEQRQDRDMAHGVGRQEALQPGRRRWPGCPAWVR